MERDTSLRANLRVLAIPGLLLVVVFVLAACGSSSARTAVPVAPTLAATAVATAQTAVAVPAVTPTAGPTVVPTAVFPSTPQTLVVQWEKNAKLGDILTDPQGRTIYTYKNDKPDQSACTGDCAKTWPPITVPKDWQPFAEPGVPGRLGVIARPDGTYQVTHDGAPLYRYSGDKNPGDTNGQEVNGLWSVVTVTPSPTAQATP